MGDKLEFPSITQKFSLCEDHRTGRMVDFYFTIGFTDGLCDYMSLRITDDRYKSLIVLVDTASMAFQKGVVLQDIVDTWKFHCYDPAGVTNCELVPFCKSVPDLLAKWIEKRFLQGPEA